MYHYWFWYIQNSERISWHDNQFFVDHFRQLFPNIIYQRKCPMHKKQLFIWKCCRYYQTIFWKTTVNFTLQVVILKRYFFYFIISFFYDNIITKNKLKNRRLTLSHTVHTVYAPIVLYVQYTISTVFLLYILYSMLLYILSTL